MPYVTCPTCGERGKIPSSLIGVRIKCRKCGLSFLVSPPAGRAAVGAGVGAEMSAGHAATLGPSAAVEAHGIEVEGLDASAWAVPTEAAAAVAAMPTGGEVPATGAIAEPEAGSSPGPAKSTSSAAREYKLLTSRDKCFEGKFDLARLEDALNQLARLGWAAKTMTTPHLKGYSGALEEVVVVLLERCHEAS
jgi:ribosomal protein S27E